MVQNNAGRLSAFLPDEHGRVARRRARPGQRRIFPAEAGAHPAIFQYGQLGERLDDLMGPRDALPRDTVRRLAGDVDAAKSDMTAVGGEYSVDQVEDGRLAGAVRSNEAEDLALADCKAQLIDGPQPAEPLAQVLDLEQRRHSSTALVRGQRPYIQPINPPGTNSTIRSRRAPETTSWKFENDSDVNSQPRSSS